jgi:single-strand DNA-binding protein
MSLNKAMIIGNLGRDPEMRYTPSGQAVTQFTVAVNRNYKDSNGDWQEETEWFRVVAWAALAERTAEYLRKGRKVYVEGRLQTRSWEDQNGQKRYTTELIANTVTPLDPRPRDEGDPGPGPGGFARSGDRGAASGDRAEGRAPAAAPAGRGGGGGDGGPAFEDAGDLDDLPF